MATSYDLTRGQIDVMFVASGTLAGFCGSNRYDIIEDFAVQLILYAGQHPALTTWQEIVKAYVAQLPPEPKAVAA